MAYPYSYWHRASFCDFDVEWHGVRSIPETIREVISKNEIGSFIGTYVVLEKRGTELVGLCPFHADSSSSFHVHPGRGFFKCFGCGEIGDVIRFVCLRENLPFIDALRALARRAGIEIE